MQRFLRLKRLKRTTFALLALLTLLAVALPLDLGALAAGASTLASWQRGGILFTHSTLSGELASHPETSHSAGKRVVVLSVSQIINHPVVSTGCGRHSPVAPGASGDFSLSSGGMRRYYRVHVRRSFLCHSLAAGSIQHLGW